MREFLGRKYGSFTAVALFCALIAALGVAFVTRATTKLLEGDAEMVTDEWANYIVSNVPDLTEIAQGETPSNESVIFFEQARQVGRVYAFSIYDPDGRLILKSNELGRTQTFDSNIFETRPEFTKARETRQRVMFVNESGAGNEPEVYADALIPIGTQGNLDGWLEIRVDQTRRQRLFMSSMTSIALIIGLILGAGPAIGFWYRTRQKQIAERQLDYLSHFDAASGLLNRGAWLDRLGGLLAGRTQGTSRAAVFQIDLNGFKLATDNYGPAAGDCFLKEMAKRVITEPFAQATFARVNSGQFAAFLPRVTDAIDAAHVARQLVEALSRPVEWEGHILGSPISVGVALVPDDGADASRLWTAASIALEEAIDAGRNCYRFFAAETERQTQKQRELEQTIADAYERHYFELHYQPIIDLKSRQLRGFEALIRLNHPEKGMISPADFIPVAEKTGDIQKIGAWCLEEACRTASFWPSDLTVSVNLSPIQFNSGQLISVLRRALDGANFPAYRLELEVTEGLLLGNVEVIKEQLTILRDMGIAIALDDFGTGYSSLSYLWQFPFSKIKIDQSFIRAIEATPSAPGILKTIIALGRYLSVPMTAEGVETAEQARFLERAGCQLAQGYLFSRPVPGTEVASIILKDFTKSLAKKPAQRKPRRRKAKEPEQVIG
jgi:diguanylate cyclase (GGDEF)-like protein